MAIDSNGVSSTAGSYSGGLHSSNTIGPSSSTSSKIYNASTNTYSGRSSSRREKDEDLDDITNAYNYAMYLDNRNYNTNAYKQAQAWEEKMSNTAVQRQVEDMKKAGINPILAGKYGGSSYNSVSPYYTNTFPTYSNDYGLAAYNANARSSQISQEAEETRATLATQLSNSKELTILAYNQELDKINLQHFNAKELESMREAAADALNYRDNFTKDLIAEEDRSARADENAKNNDNALTLADKNNLARKELAKFQAQLDFYLEEFKLTGNWSSSALGALSSILR